MSRIVRQGQNLDGQILNVSQQPDGHARQSLLLNCSIDGATFIGDIRGSDVLRCPGSADFSQAQTYALYWRGCTDMADSVFPADIGWLHHEPVGTIIRQRVQLLPAEARKAVKAVAAFVLSGDYALASWDTSRGLWWDDATPAQRQKLANAFRFVFEPYPRLAQRMKELMRTLKTGGTQFEGASPTCTVRWPDGAEILIDAMNLPTLDESSRYALARWTEVQADAQRPGSHYCFVYSASPPVVIPLPQPDAWLTGPGGY